MLNCATWNIKGWWMWHSSSDMAQVNTDMAHLEPANIQDTVASGVFDPPTHHATIEFSNFTIT